MDYPLQELLGLIRLISSKGHETYHVVQAEISSDGTEWVSLTFSNIASWEATALAALASG